MGKYERIFAVDASGEFSSVQAAIDSIPVSSKDRIVIRTKPEVWHNWGKESNEQTARYSEHKCIGPGANRAKRVAWSSELNQAVAANYTL